MITELVTLPAQYPVSLAEGKKQCEIDTSDTAHDTYVKSLIMAALVTGQEAVFYINDAQYLQIKAPAGVTIRIGAVTSAVFGHTMNKGDK